MHLVWIGSNYALVYGFYHEASSSRIIPDPAGPVEIRRTADSPENLREDWLFLAAVGRTLTPAREIIVTGLGLRQLELKKYLDEERPCLARKVVGVGVLDSPDDAGIAEFAEMFFRAAR
jgi:hypothetical protein